MRAIVADTTPLNYLVLIQAADILPNLYRTVLIPPAVKAELAHAIGLKLVGTLAALDLAAAHGSVPADVASSSLVVPAILFCLGIKGSKTREISVQDGSVDFALFCSQSSEANALDSTLWIQVNEP